MSEWYDVEHFANFLRDMSNHADDFSMNEDESLMAIIKRIPETSPFSKRLWELSAKLEDLAGEFDLVSDDMAREDP